MLVEGFRLPPHHHSPFLGSQFRRLPLSAFILYQTHLLFLSCLAAIARLLHSVRALVLHAHRLPTRIAPRSL